MKERKLAHLVLTVGEQPLPVLATVAALAPERVTAVVSDRSAAVWHRVAAHLGRSKSASGDTEVFVDVNDGRSIYGRMIMISDFGAADYAYTCGTKAMAVAGDAAREHHGTPIGASWYLNDDAGLMLSDLEGVKPVAVPNLRLTPNSLATLHGARVKVKRCVAPDSSVGMPTGGNKKDLAKDAVAQSTFGQQCLAQMFAAAGRASVHRLLVVRSPRVSHSRLESNMWLVVGHRGLTVFAQQCTWLEGEKNDQRAQSDDALFAQAWAIAREIGGAHARVGILQPWDAVLKPGESLGQFRERLRTDDAVSSTVHHYRGAPRMSWRLTPQRGSFEPDSSGASDLSRILRRERRES